MNLQKRAWMYFDAWNPRYEDELSARFYMAGRRAFIRIKADSCTVVERPARASDCIRFPNAFRRYVSDALDWVWQTREWWERRWCEPQGIPTVQPFARRLVASDAETTAAGVSMFYRLRVRAMRWWPRIVAWWVAP